MRSSGDLPGNFLVHPCPIVTGNGYVQLPRAERDMTIRCSKQVLRFGSHHQD